MNGFKLVLASAAALLAAAPAAAAEVRATLAVSAVVVAPCTVSTRAGGADARCGGETSRTSAPARSETSAQAAPAGTGTVRYVTINY